MTETQKRFPVLFVESGSIRLSADARRFLNIPDKFQGRIQDIEVGDKVFTTPYVATKKTGEVHLFLGVKGDGGCASLFKEGEEIAIGLK